MGNSAVVDNKAGMFVQMIMFPEQETLLGGFISDGQLKKQAADDGKTESSKENMQTVSKKGAWIKEQTVCLCLSCVAGKAFTHRWRNGTDFHL